MVRIVFFGTPTFAVPALSALIDSPYEVVALVAQPDRPKNRGQHVAPTPTRLVAEAHGIPVLTPEHLKAPAFLSTLEAVRPDLGVVAAYGKILPDAVLAAPRLRMVNLHASLLPRHRGASPVQAAIRAGDRVTGVSLMRVVSELDAGPILATVEHRIGPDDTAADLERALASLAAELILRQVGPLVAGRLDEHVQDEASATYAPRLAKADGQVDWTRIAQVVHDHVRAMNPWPRAFSHLNAKRYVIFRTAPTSPPRAGGPGEVLEASGERLVVAAGDATAIQVLDIQPAGRRTMPARAFLAGYTVRPGSRFGPATAP